MAQEKLCILFFQPFTSTTYLLFCFLLTRELRGLASAHAWFIQQGGWSWDHHHVLPEVSVALKSQRTERSYLSYLSLSSSPLVLKGSFVNEMEHGDNFI